jgi:hypothetical protein
MSNKICLKCNENKPIENYYEKNHTTICKDCHNYKRRQRYNTDEEYRKKVIKERSICKHNKVLERQKILEEQQLLIGIENKQCRYCNEIKHKDRFRHNRRKCRDCERDEPLEKFKRYIRTRIYNCLKGYNKSKHSYEYLGCTPSEYFEYIFNYNNNYNIDNYGKLWHIDHVIPISKFNLDNPEETLLAFNWRNTMPLSSSENLSKNNKIIKEQVNAHIIKLQEYHITNKLDLPQVYFQLFAKHLDAGNPLEPLLPLTLGNEC